MNRRYASIWVFIITIFALGCVTAWLSASSAVKGQPQTEQTSLNEYEDPFVRLNRKAQAAKGNSQTTVQGLADEVFTWFRVPNVPSDTVALMKDRVLRAETNYRRGNKGVQENRVVQMINELADKFKAPNYTKTSPAQVRQTRVSLMLYLPNFVAQAQPVGVGNRKTVNSEMSPLEATYLAMFMFYQKMNSEEYQVTPQEWSEKIERKLAEKHFELKEKKQENKKGKPPEVSAKEFNPKKDEVEQAIAKGSADMNFNELLNLANTSLDTLGIER